MNEESRNESQNVRTGKWEPSQPIPFRNWLGSGRLAIWWHDHIVERFWRW